VLCDNFVQLLNSEFEPEMNCILDSLLVLRRLMDARGISSTQTMPSWQLNNLTLTQLVLTLAAVVASFRASGEVLREVTILSIRVSSVVIFSADQHTTRV
jgi:hypothetical protein